MKTIIKDHNIRTKRRVRGGIVGTKSKPRISVFRSNKYIYGQAIDDMGRSTISSVSSLNLKSDAGTKEMKKIELSKAVGLELGKNLIKKKINEAIFDRGSYRYLGHVKQFCEGLREAGISI